MCEFCGERGAGPISLGMCGMLMMVWHRDTQNWRNCPNSFPHTFSHPLILRRFTFVGFPRKCHWIYEDLYSKAMMYPPHLWRYLIMRITLPPTHPSIQPSPPRHQLVTLGALICFTPLLSNTNSCWWIKIYIRWCLETLAIMEGLWLGNEVSCFTIST